MILLMKLLSKNKTTTSKSFHYKAKVIERAPVTSCRLNTKVVVPLKYVSTFRISLDLPMISCEIELHLTWSENCIISEILNNVEIPANLAANLPIAHLPQGYTTDAALEINSANLYVPTVTLSINYNIKFL